MPKPRPTLVEFRFQVGTVVAHNLMSLVPAQGRYRGKVYARAFKESLGGSSEIQYWVKWVNAQGDMSEGEWLPEHELDNAE